MSLAIGSSLSGGIRRVVNRNGLVLALAYIIVGGIWQVLFYSAIATWLSQSGPASQSAPLPTVDIPLVISVSGTIILLLVLQYLTIISIRTFVGGHSRSIPTEYYKRNIGFVLLNTIIGSIAFGLVVFLGSLLLVIPGIIAYVAFIFMLLYVTAEDENVITAFSSSWNLTRGHWLKLFLLLLVVFVSLGIIQAVLGVLTSLGVSIVAGAGLATLVSGVIGLPFSLFILGILAEAFTQLRQNQHTSY